MWHSLREARFALFFRQVFRPLLISMALCCWLWLAALAGQAAQRTLNAGAIKAIVLEHAGYSAAEAAFSKLNLQEKEQGPRYELEFTTREGKFCYEVDAVSGKILAYSAQEAQATPKAAPSGNPIGEDKAKALAFTHARLDAGKVQNCEGALLKENGREVYAIKFKQGGLQYQYAVDAYSGEILTWKRDGEN